MRVALDATPLLGARTGIGTFASGAIQGLARRADLSLVGYSLTRRAGPSLPARVAAGRRLPAALALRLWGAGLDWPGSRWLSRGEVDIVHGTNFVVPPGRGAGRVVTVHDLSMLTFPELCTPTTLRYPALLRRAISEGAWVHTPSQFVADEVVAWLGAPAERVRAVAHGVEPGGGDGQVGRQVAGAERYVLAVGTVEPRKDLPLLVRAWDKVAGGHPTIRLVLAGPDGWGADALDDARHNARHRDRVVRLGWVDDATRRDLLAGASLLVFPSVYEGFGLPPLEAMAAGVPVVATAAGAVPEIVGDAALTVAVGDELSLADAIASVLDDPSLADQLIVAGRERSAAYTWDACASGLVALYQAARASR